MIVTKNYCLYNKPNIIVNKNMKFVMPINSSTVLNIVKYLCLFVFNYNKKKHNTICQKPCIQIPVSLILFLFFSSTLKSILNIFSFDPPNAIS